MPEEWRLIPGWPYEVSSAGRVRNRRTGLILAERRKKNGYVHVTLHSNGLKKEAHVHRLVCEAFHGPPPQPDFHADHFPDKTRHRNDAGNLRWLSPQENRAARLFRSGEAHHSSKFSDATRELIIRSEESSYTLAPKVGVSPSYIRSIRSRHKKGRNNHGSSPSRSPQANRNADVRP